MQQLVRQNEKGREQLRPDHVDHGFCECYRASSVRADPSMGRYRDHRPPRSQGLGGDKPQNSEPTYFERRPARKQASPAETSPAHDAEVVWFNGEKGFGFLKLSDGSDAFLHVSKLQAAGHDSLPEGAALKVRTEPGQKGLQVVEVISVEAGESTPTGRAAARPAPVRQPSADEGEQEGTGVVKRYDPIKGFGFIALDGGGKDVFVHATALTRNGVATLEAGQNVAVTYGPGRKGLEVRTIRFRE